MTQNVFNLVLWFLRNKQFRKNDIFFCYTLYVYYLNPCPHLIDFILIPFFNLNVTFKNEHFTTNLQFLPASRLSLAPRAGHRTPSDTFTFFRFGVLDKITFLILTHFKTTPISISPLCSSFFSYLSDLLIFFLFNFLFPISSLSHLSHL